jgi:hypothetical protein
VGRADRHERGEPVAVSGGVPMAAHGEISMAAVIVALRAAGRPLPRGSGRPRRRATDARKGRHASAPSERLRTTATAGESGRKPGLGQPSLDRPKRRGAEPVPHRTPIRGRAPHERTTARRRWPPRNRAALYRRPPVARWSSSTSSRRPSSSARRPDRLAFYIGYCSHRRKGHMRCRKGDGSKLSRRSGSRAWRLLVIRSGHAGDRHSGARI